MMEFDRPRGSRSVWTSPLKTRYRLIAAWVAAVGACATAAAAAPSDAGEVAAARALAPRTATESRTVDYANAAQRPLQQAVPATAMLAPPATGSANAATTDSDDPAVQTTLAMRYEHAEGVPRDYVKAHALYCRAAREGFLDAQFALGWMYANGRGVPRDDGIAAAFFEIAAEQGHPGATKLLSLFQRRPDTELPQCMLPDPPVYTAKEYDVPIVIDEPEFDEPLHAPRNDIERLVYRIAPRYAVDPRLALAVISVESDFKPQAVSPKNAQGLMQLIPETATRFGVKRIRNPVENINGGLAYLRWLLAFFKGDVSLVAAAYNAGERAVEKYRGVPPYAETRQYVKKITALYKKPAHPYQTGIVEPSEMLAKMRPRTR